MTRGYWMVGSGIVIAAWVATLVLYPGLPAKIPSHWDIHGRLDGYGPKEVLFALPSVMVGMLILFLALPALSPRDFEVDAFRSTYLYIMNLVLGLFGYMHGLTLYAAMSNRIDVARWIVGGAFLFFASLGNVLGRVRRNFYIGVRVPWTLASERVWNDTHRVAAWSFTAAGLAGLALVAAGVPLAASFAPMVVGLVVPVVYSFLHYKRLERRGAL